MEGRQMSKLVDTGPGTRGGQGSNHKFIEGEIGLTGPQWCGVVATRTQQLYCDNRRWKLSVLLNNKNKPSTFLLQGPEVNTTKPLKTKFYKKFTKKKVAVVQIGKLWGYSCPTFIYYKYFAPSEWSIALKVKSGAERERESREPDLDNKTQRLGRAVLPQIYCLAFHVKMSLSVSLYLYCFYCTEWSGLPL